jgi:hypothetical protein
MAVGAADLPAAETDRRNFQVGSSEMPELHGRRLLSARMLILPRAVGQVRRVRVAEAVDGHSELRLDSFRWEEFLRRYSDSALVPSFQIATDMV